MWLIVVCFLGISGFKKGKSIVNNNMVFLYEEHLTFKLRILDQVCIMAGKKISIEKDFKLIAFSENTRQMKMWSPRPKYTGTNFNADIFKIVI